MKFQVTIRSAFAGDTETHKYEIRNHEKGGEVAAAYMALKIFEESGLGSRDSRVFPHGLQITVDHIDERYDEA